MTENNDGGFLIPKVAYVDTVKDGILWRAVCWLGQRFIIFGVWLRSLGYTRKEIHPYDDLMNAMRNKKVER